MRDEEVKEGLYRASGMIDTSQEEMSEHVERGIRRKLLEELEPLLFSGQRFVVKISREEREPEKIVSWAREGTHQVIYSADIARVHTRQCVQAEYEQTKAEPQKKEGLIAKLIRTVRKKVRGRTQ